MENDSRNKQWVFAELKNVTNYLTISSIDDFDQAVGLSVVDDIALDFDNYLSAARPYLELENPIGLKLLNSIDEELEKVSGAENSELWTKHAFLEHEKWNRIRSFANEAVKHFNWA